METGRSFLNAPSGWWEVARVASIRKERIRTLLHSVLISLSLSHLVTRKSICC